MHRRFGRGTPPQIPDPVSSTPGRDVPVEGASIQRATIPGESAESDLGYTLARAADPVLLCLVVAETAIVWLAASLLLATDPSASRALPWVVTLALLLGAAVLPRVLELRGVWDPGFSTVMAVGIVGTTLLLVKTAAYPDTPWLDLSWLRDTTRALTLRPSDAVTPIWGLVLLSAYAWARGRRRAEPTLDAAYSGLRIGAIAALITALADGVTPAPISDTAVVWSVLVFVAASLAAISLARMVGDRENRYPGLRSPAVLGGVLLPIAVVGLVGLLIGSVATRDLLDAILWSLSPLIWALSVLLRIIVLIVAVIAFIIVSPILWLLSGTEFAPISSTPRGTDSELQDRVRDELERSADVPDPIRYLIVAAVLFSLVALLGRFALRGRRRRDIVGDEERTSLLSGTELLATLGTNLRRALGLLRTDTDPLADLRTDRRWAHTVRIREAYAALLRHSAERGLPRPSGRTPQEHAAHLTAGGGHGPGIAADIHRLTNIYDRARYSDTPATAADADAAIAALRSIEREGGDHA